MTDLPDATEAAPLLYRCPMCGAEVSIQRKLFGETVDCPKCKGPFQVEPPKAHPVGDHPAMSNSRDVTNGDGVGTDGTTTVPHEAGRSKTTPEIDHRAKDEWTEIVVHPVVFRRHLLGTLFAILLIVGGLIGLVGGLAGYELFGIAGMVATIGGAVLAVVGLVFLGRWYLLSRVQSLTLTNERLVYQYGLIQRSTSEVRHDDVRNLKVSQNLVERLLSYGDIAISSAGQDDMEIVINDIPNPETVANFIRDRQ